MSNKAVRIVALEAARFMVQGTENEYLYAKQRAVMQLGLSKQTRLPSNRKVKNCIALLTREELGEDEVKRRVQRMRQIAQEIMSAIEDCDPFLIGSTLSGKIRCTSDIDLHAYCDDWEILKEHLLAVGYTDVEEEIVENRKGRFVHLRWEEEGYPVEVTIYPWSARDELMYSSVTGKPMKRADLKAVRRLLQSPNIHFRE